jgi:hypothetical protein
MLNASQLSQRIETSREAKKVFERKWELCLRFLAGEQHRGWDAVTQSYSDSNARAQKHIVINLILPIYKNLLSRLATAYPGVAVMPASPSSSDVSKATASEAYLRYWWGANKIDRLGRKVVANLLSTGTAAVHVYWADGSARADAVQAQDLFFDAAVLDPEDSAWIAVRCWSRKEDVYAQFPEAAEALKDMDPSDADGPVNKLHYDDGAGPPGTYEVFEVYHDGKITVLCKGVQLYHGDMPNGIRPVHIMRWTEVPNIVWGQGLVEPLLDLQRVYNASREMVMNNAALMANPKWLVPKGAGLSDGSFTARPGEKILHEPGLKPEQVPGVPLPSYVTDNIRQTHADMLNTAGVHSATLGNRPTGGLSGKAIDSLVANDLSSIQVSQSGIEDAFEDMAADVLVLTKAYMSEATMIRQLDGLGHAIFFELQQADIVDDPDVIIEAGTLFQDSIESRERRVLDMFQAGLIDKDVAMRELSFRTGNAYLLKQLQNISHAREMLNAVKLGAMIEILPGDDKEAFASVFGEFLRNPEFYELPVERQNYITDLLRMLTGEDAARPVGAPESAAEAAEQLGLQRSPASQAQIAGMAVQGAADQSYLDDVQNEAARADGAIPEA